MYRLLDMLDIMYKKVPSYKN
ncbi:hypothetical protein CGLO_13331 [Colletotrichum gloeosporioides Cg-14]|uniref:Uncharacterized protein n=1 Tax=Colletotrichum gloeosporioides (strain Cg-14) TaxID=1237896 RepID=T0K6B7_COLGC|nr:hypothetical protein CGLO_13331 [Colletotrichum gloeosporioides Cg-14]